MADDDSDGGVVERLERALARIEACVEQPDPAQAPLQSEVAARLDAVIARLRAELEG